MERGRTKLTPWQVYMCTQLHSSTYIHTCMYHMYWSTVGFRWSWAWNDERGEWEFEKLNKITQYRHNINTSIKKRVILSFYNVSCSLSDTWFADKRKNIFFTRPTNIFFHFWFDVFMIFWFFRSKLGPLRNMRRKNPSRFPIPVKVSLKEATSSVDDASFALLWYLVR